MFVLKKKYKRKKMGAKKNGKTNLFFVLHEVLEHEKLIWGEISGKNCFLWELKVLIGEEHERTFCTNKLA